MRCSLYSQLHLPSPPPPQQAASADSHEPLNSQPPVQPSCFTAASDPPHLSSCVSLELERRPSEGGVEGGGSSTRSRLEEIEALIRALEIQRREMSHAHPLSIIDFSPEWDDVSGGGKMLLTAHITQGFSYLGSFGGVTTTAECIAPNVLRLRAPPSPTGLPAVVPLQLLRLDGEGKPKQYLECGDEKSIQGLSPSRTPSSVKLTSK